MKQWIIGGRVIDPFCGMDRRADLLIEDSRIRAIVDSLERPFSNDDVQWFDATGCIVAPGLIDSHVSFREPGDEEDETTQSGSAAALAGGFTTVACLPDTSPAVDSRAAAEFITLQGERAGNCRVMPIGAVTKSIEGKELAEIGQLVEGGAVALSDGKRPIANAEIMRRSLQYAGMFDRAILSHSQVPELVEGGVMHEGYHSMLLGLRGMPSAAETIMVARDLALAHLTSGRLHLMTISTEGAVDLIRQAKSNGAQVTADVTPHHLTLLDDSLRTFDSNYKVDPPLRSAEHRDALIEGLRDGTIDMISSDHQPFAEEKKAGEIVSDPFGITSLESSLALLNMALIEPGHLTWLQLLAKLTINPARLLRLPYGTLQIDRPADVVVIDPLAEWTIDPVNYRSRSRNTPFGGWKVRGMVRAAFVDGQLRHRADPVPIN